jgi:agmatinase
MDSTTSYRPGTRLAPYRVREVSDAIEEYSVYQDCSLEEIDFYDPEMYVFLMAMYWKACSVWSRWQVFFGTGQKAFLYRRRAPVSLPIIRAYHQYYPELTVIQMDAHADLRSDTWEKLFLTQL